MALGTRATVEEHFDAFNAHDTARILAGLHPEVTWATGADRSAGLDAMAEMFDEWLWSMNPRIDVVRLFVEGDGAAAECVEHLVVDGQPVSLPIGVFVTVADGLIRSVKVFREGSADLE